MSTEQQRQQWRELAAAATGGVWRTGPSRYNVIASGKGNGKIATMDGDDGDKLFNNAAFIAAARAAVPALLADVDALTAERDALAAELERVRAQLDAVPVDDIRKVTKAADMDGYSNWRVDEWLDELAQLAHTPTPGTR